MIASQRGFISIMILLAIIGLIGILVIANFAPFQGQLAHIFPKSASLAAGSVYLETFDGNLVTPIPFNSTNRWDVAVSSRDTVTLRQLTPMLAHHGADCSPPLDAAGKLVTHQTTGDYGQAVFICKDHLMTSIRAGVHGAPDEGVVQPAETDGYGVIYLTPNQIVDFSQGPVTIKFDITTWAASGRDWWDIWITPYDDNLQLPLYDWLPDLQGPPKNAIHFQESDMNGSGPGLKYDSFANFTDRGDSGGTNWWTSYESFMKTSPQKRTTFEFQISKTHIRAGIPAGQVDQDGNPINGGQAFWWIDKDIPALSWDKGVLQLGHHSYNPNKDCNVANHPAPDGTCNPNTWHWDNLSISNATPFTIIPGDKRYLDGETTGEINFNTPAPDNSFLRYSQLMGNTQLSFNNGQTWFTPQKQSQQKDCLNGHFCNMWQPIPAGTQKVIFKTTKSSGYWWTDQGFAKDFAIWSLTEPAIASPSASVLLLSPTPLKTGDIDGNGKVDIFDYNILLTNFGKNGTGIQGDVNNSGKVDIFDYNILLTSFGK